MICQARQYSDQMQCSRCGLSWDVNDPDRPQCKTEELRKAGKAPELAQPYSPGPWSPLTDDPVKKILEDLDK